MLKALIGKKLNMSQIYDSHGRVTPVTKIKLEPNVVIALRDKDNDGYKAAQVGIGISKKVTKPLKGHFDKAKLKSIPKIVKEVSFDGDLQLAQEVRLEEVFHKGALVDVVGKSKGKGFAGVIKRWGFHGGPKTHGQSDRHRAPGSIGSGTTPGRVQKGLKMAGHMGNAQVSIFGLEIMQVDKEDNVLIVKGSIPGPTGATVLIKKSKKKRPDYHEPEIPALPNLGGASEETSEGKPENVSEVAETVVEIKEEPKTETSGE